MWYILEPSDLEKPGKPEKKVDIISFQENHGKSWKKVGLEENLREVFLS